MKKETVYATLVGGFIGDALGVPVEFLPRETIKKNPIKDMTGFGSHLMPPGSWSDDTSMTLCLMESLNKGIDSDYLMHFFLKWMENGYDTPFEEVFDIGLGTQCAIKRYQNGVPAIKCGGSDEMDNGNGALMRIAPLALYLHSEKNFQKRLTSIVSITKPTHSHPKSILASIIYIELLIQLFNAKSIEQALSSLSKEFPIQLPLVYQNEWENYKSLFRPNFKNHLENQISSSGYVVDTLEASIWVLLNSSDYSSAVLKAVNLGDDSDTTGMVTGTLAGALYGMTAIPNTWKNELQNLPLLKEKLSNFSKLIVG